MPPVTKPKTEAKKPATPKVVKEGRPVLYPTYTLKTCCLPKDGVEYDGPITIDIAKKLLGWEVEDDYTKRLLAADPKMKQSRAVYGDRFLLKNYAGDKVNCWHNAKNRPFDLTHAKKIGQDILNKNWEMNCENIIVGQTGIIISGQHRLIGFILAVEEYHATKLKGEAKSKWQEIWGDEEPVLEAMIAFGCREDPKVIRTIDNVKSRTLSDTIFTSPIFESIKSTTDRAECARYMDFAVDLLWRRTKQADGWNKYQTHSSSIDFLDKHPKLKACVKHIFDNNRDRVISRLGLSPGQSAGMMYLMACSDTEADDYHYVGSPKTEKQLNFDKYDLAHDFWSSMVDPESEQFGVIRDKIAGFRDPSTGDNVPEKVKQMILSLAWNAFSKGETVTEEMLSLGEYLTWSDAKERTLISEEPTVGGIDCGLVKSGGEEDEIIPTAEEQEEEKIKLRDERAKRMKDVAKGKPVIEDEEYASPTDDESDPSEPNDEDRALVEDDEPESPNPLVEAKKTAPTTTRAKAPSPFSEEERAKLVAQMQPRGANNEKPKPPPKPKLTPR